ncbi:hypothetical protein [Brachybacterium sp. GPGPB12]|uniref:hypothetical protein n=1 Tax=Brachybacterium sp. GPGPB12 TaxID=3023517 RepID=UPI0031345F86
MSVTVHRTTATAVRAGDGPATWNVELEDRAPLRADLLLLAAGHTDSRPNAARHELAAFARRHGGTYLGPSQASDAQVEPLGAGQDVIVRGMGLAFIDLMAPLTEGRGGRFVPAAEAESAGEDAAAGLRGRLDYLPSGEEPRLWVGSRRGVPYHSKVRDEGAPTGLGELVHVTPANLRALEDEHGLLDFRADVSPLIAAEIAHQVPGAPLAQEGEEPLAWLDEPLSDLGATTAPEAAQQATRDAVVGHIEADLRDRIGGEVTAARTLFQLLLRLHGVLVDQLPATRLRGGARGDYPRWWHSLFSFVDSGPPPHRLQQAARPRARGHHPLPRTGPAGHGRRDQRPVPRPRRHRRRCRGRRARGRLPARALAAGVDQPARCATWSRAATPPSGGSPPPRPAPSTPTPATA